MISNKVIVNACGLIRELSAMIRDPLCDCSIEAVIFKAMMPVISKPSGVVNGIGCHSLLVNSKRPLLFSASVCHLLASDQQFVSLG
jgi:hypothetical protein